MQTQKITQIGNSAGVIIPSQLIQKMGLKKGSKVTMELASDEKTLVISKQGSTSGPPSITPEFVKIVNSINKRYAKVFSDLAKK